MAMTTIWFDESLRKKHWPRPLADEWHREYPQLFDDDDLRITQQQEQGHFYEWLAAITLFHRSGVLALVEKYLFGRAHPRKDRIVRRLLTPDQIACLRSLPNQPPDLLLYTPTFDRFWFAEVKGPTDHLRPVQLRTHETIMATLGVEVEIVRFQRVKSGLTRG